MPFKKILLKLLLLLFSVSVYANAVKPTPAQDFSLFDIQSQAPIKLSDHFGKVIYLDFWASWCSSCIKSLPLFSQWQQELGEKFVVISVNVDEDKADGIAMVQRLKLKYPIGYDIDLQVAKMYKTSVLPYSFIIDTKGNIHYQHVGFQDKDAAKLKQIIIELMK